MQESPSEVVPAPAAAGSGASTVTFLFSDIEGSTALWETHPDEMTQALAHHDTTLRDVVESNRGCLLYTSDAADE